MAFKNLDDNTSTTVTTATPGRTIDLRYRSTIGRASLGVPVVMKVVATATAGDTGAINLIDSTGTHMLSCVCNLGGTNNYAVSGYLPATLAKYDLEYGGNTLGSLTPLGVDVYEYDAMGITISASLASTIAAITLAGTGTVASSGINGELDQTIAAVTLAGTGTVANAETPPAYSSAGTAATGSGNLTPGGTSAAGNDVEILVVVQGWVSALSDATLNTANGFAAITGAGIDSGSDGGIYSHTTLFWRRGGGSDPVVTNGVYGVARIYKYTGVITSGNPWDVLGTTADVDNDTSLSLGGATTTVTNTLACGFVGGFIQATGASLASWSNGNLTNVTERDDTAYSVGGEDMHLAHVTGEKATASATGATTATWSGIGTWAAVTGIVVALKPA